MYEILETPVNVLISFPIFHTKQIQLGIEG